MTTSLYQIDFHPASGSALRLLDYGDQLASPLQFAVSQQSQTWIPLGMPWGVGVAGGGLRRSLTWQRHTEHASQAQADSYVQIHPLSLPFLGTGHLRVSVSGGEVWDMGDAVILNVSASHDTEGDFATITDYQFDCGHTLPQSGLRWFPGVMSEWDQTSHASQPRHTDGILPPWQGPIMEVRITDDGTQKWFEAGFMADTLLTGSAATGWTGPDGILRIDLLRSENLLSWTTGDFSDCSGSPTDNGDGTYTYWSRSKYPNDSKSKTGVMVARGIPGFEDSRNQPFTGIEFQGVTLSLPNYPYQMPGDAAMLQADLVAAGYPGATVISADWDDWTITVPSVSFTTYNLFNYVLWPVYLVPDNQGRVVNPMIGRSFSGTFINSSGVHTALPQQFVEMRISTAP